MEDFLPGEWFSPMLDGTNVEGKFKTRKGLVAMKKGNLQVSNKDILLKLHLASLVSNSRGEYLSPKNETVYWPIWGIPKLSDILDRKILKISGIPYVPKL